MLPLSNADSSTLAHMIQLSIAPVFLLTAIAGFLGAISVRLGRVIDRARKLEAEVPSHADDSRERKLLVAELAVLDRRMILAHRAVSLSVAAAISVCIIIILLFLSSISGLHPDQIVPVLFMVAMALQTAGLISFALETRIGTRTVRVRAELILSAPPPPGSISIPNPFRH